MCQDLQVSLAGSVFSGMIGAKYNGEGGRRYEFQRRSRKKMNSGSLSRGDFSTSVPELSEKEVNTTKEIGKRLEEMGLEPHYYDGYTGLTADIKGGKAGAGTKTVAPAGGH